MLLRLLMGWVWRQLASLTPIDDGWVETAGRDLAAAWRIETMTNGAVTAPERSA